MIAALLAASIAVPPSAGTDVRRILDTLQTVETGGERDPDAAVGDGGKALGAYQIWRIYWVDACQYDPSLRARGYEAVTDREYAERVVIAYLSRYCKTWTIDECARIHNGGPAGATKRRKATDDYAAKARKEWQRCDT